MSALGPYDQQQKIAGAQCPATTDVFAMHFDHLMHWVPDLTAAAAYRALGFTIRDDIAQHPGAGTESLSWRSGWVYVELITVCNRAEAAESRGRAWPALDALLQAGGGAGRFVVQVEDLTQTVARLDAQGIRTVGPVERSALLSDGTNGQWLMASVLGGPLWGPNFSEYSQAVTASKQRSREARDGDPWVIDHLVIETPDPASGATWLGRVLDLEPVKRGAGEWQVPLPGCALHFVPGDADRVTEVRLAGPDAPAGEVCGLRYGPQET